MHSEYSYLIDLGIMLLAASVGGMISKKLKQPEVLGQILIGIVLGMGILKPTDFTSHLAEIGVIFLMFIAGLETDVSELKESGKSSSMVALGGIIFPLAMVFGGVYLITGDLVMSAFMGVVSTATSVSISVQTLREMNQLRTRQGVTILGSAIIDDIVGILLLTALIGFVSPQSGGSIFLVTGKILLFFLVTMVVGFIIIKLVKNYEVQFNPEERVVTYAIIICFALAFLSEEMGVAAITGAYFTGVVFSMTSQRHRVVHNINRIATVMFTPLFFVSIGMGVDIVGAFSAIGIGSVIILLGILGKIFGSGLGALLSGYDKDEALQVGIGMVPRAEVAIIIANLGFKLGFIGQGELGAVILMVIVTTLVTPALLKWSFNRTLKDRA